MEFRREQQRFAGDLQRAEGGRGQSVRAGVESGV